MKRNAMHLGIVGGLVVCVAGVAWGQTSKPAAGQMLTCNGSIVDAADKPVEGAEVVAYVVTWSPAKTTLELLGKATTKADGTFAFRSARGKGESFCMIAARKTGLALGWTNWRMQKDRKMTIRLGAPTTLQGRVYGPGKELKGLKGVEVRGIFIQDRHKEGATLLVGLPPFDWVTARTDAKGKFAMGGLPKKAGARLVATAPGYAAGYGGLLGPDSAWHTVGDTHDRALLRLRRPVTLRGKLVDAESNAPVAKMRLVVRNRDQLKEMYFLPAITAVTNADGTFEVPGLTPARSYSIQAAAGPGGRVEWAVHPSSLQVDAKKPKEPPTFSLVQDGGHAEIVVVAADTGKPIAGMPFWFDREQLFAARAGYCLDHRGKALLRVLPGRYRLSVSSQGPSYRSIESREYTEVIEGGMKRVEAKMQKRPSIAGTVRDPAGKPIAWAYVTVMPYQADPCHTDAEGRFRAYLYKRRSDVERLIMARHAKRGLVAIVKMPEQGEPDIRLAKGVTVTGRIVSSAGKPLRGIQGSLSMTAKKWRSTVEFLRQSDGLLDGNIDKDGRYTVTAVPAGWEYVVSGSAKGHGYSRVRVDLREAAKGPVAAKDIVLPTADKTVAGVVLDGTGKPVVNAQVTVVLQSTRTRFTERVVRTDAKGGFEVGGVVDDEVVIRVMSLTLGLKARVTVKAGDQDVKITVREVKSAVPAPPRIDRF